MSNLVLEDVYEACDIINSCDGNPNYSRIYFSSNEPLEELFQYFSVEGKDVLTVLGSSDQLFYTLYHGAKRVDTYDINQLTKYYYYLRRWTILYRNQFYPDKSILKSHQFIYDLLSQVACETPEEEDAFLFWKTYIKQVYPFDSGNLFYYNVSDNTVPNLELLQERLAKYPFSFTQQDIFESVDIGKKYDLIITSNILEYASQSPLKLMGARNNLNKLLREGGQIVCSHVFNTMDSSYFQMEHDAFQRYFDCTEFPWSMDKTLKKKMPIGYVYTKKTDVNKK